MSVTKLVQPADPHGIITVLEGMLERAKAGEFESMFCFAIRPDRTFSVVSSGTRSKLEQIGMLAVMQADTIASTIEP